MRREGFIDECAGDGDDGGNGSDDEWRIEEEEEEVEEEEDDEEDGCSGSDDVKEFLIEFESVGCGMIEFSWNSLKSWSPEIDLYELFDVIELRIGLIDWDNEDNWIWWRRSEPIYSSFCSVCELSTDGVVSGVAAEAGSEYDCNEDDDDDEIEEEEEGFCLDPKTNTWFVTSSDKR